MAVNHALHQTENKVKLKIIFPYNSEIPLQGKILEQVLTLWLGSESLGVFSESQISGPQTKISCPGGPMPRNLHFQQVSTWC